MRLIATLFVLPLAACSIGTAEPGESAEARGTGPSRDYQVTGFTGVSLRGSDDVEVRVGPAFSVRAQGPADELDKLEIRRDGDSLRIGRKRTGWSWNGSAKGVTVFVTMPNIAAASVAGSGDMSVDRAQGARFSGSIAGSGNLSVSALRVAEAELSVAGSGDLTIAGNARRIGLEIAGSGDIDARQLTAAEARISIAGSGNARATVNGPANISIAGSGDVELGGAPRCTTSTVGSGAVRCG